MFNAALLPAWDIPGHNVLHSLIRHARKGVDWRRPSEIASMGFKKNSEIVAEGLKTLLDLGFISEETSGDRTGYRVVERCSCHIKGSTRPQLQIKAHFLRDADAALAAICDSADSYLADGLGQCQSLLENETGPWLEQRHRSLEPDTAMGLVLYFRNALARKGSPVWGFSVDFMAERPFAKCLADMKRRGATPDEIRAMIDRFMRQPYRNKIPPWRMFINGKDQLLGEVREVAAKVEHLHDRDYWLGTTNATTKDDHSGDRAYWLGTNA